MTARDKTYPAARTNANHSAARRDAIHCARWISSGVSAGPDEDLARRREARSVTRAVPGLLGAVPRHVGSPCACTPATAASACRARCDRRPRAHRPSSTILPSPRRTPRSDVASGAGEAIADHVVRIVDVLLDVIPGAAADLRPARIEQIAPGIRPAECTQSRAIIAGERAERHAVAGVAGRGELTRRGLADERQAVVGLDDLARPSVRDLESRQERARVLLERAIAGGGIALPARSCDPRRRRSRSRSRDADRCRR